MVNPGNELRRKRTATGNGAVLARAGGELGSRSSARRRTRDGRPVAGGRRHRRRGQELPRAVPQAAHGAPELNNVTYGHAIEVNGRVWLQYWLWYFYNDYQLSFGAGTHEGDWEMVQFRMDDDAGHPDIAVYAQHSYAELRPWERGRALPARRRAAGRVRRARLARVVLRSRLSPDRGVVRPRRRQAPHEAPPAPRDPRHRRAGVDALARPLGRHAAEQARDEGRRVQQPDRARRQEAVDRSRPAARQQGRAEARQGAARHPTCSSSAWAAGCASSTT